ncbi:MAG: ABC transporter substrate-binding protein [Rubellimicrobium sp.]|nr:ABC transporter substrate-binding protein [Rubellimicrobium sp.]
MRPISGILTAVAGTALLAGAAWAGEINVYTALEEDEIAAYLEQAAIDMPDVTINLLRLSTGDLGARIIAEANNPQADVIWGFALTNMLHQDIYSQLAPYDAAGAAELPPQFRDADGRWFAPTGYVGAFCVNNERLEAMGAPVPHTWQELANPVYKGEVVMPDPGSSGTGYLQIAAILQGMGDDAGWQLIADLDKNMAQYTTSGSRPCRMAQAGEYAIGASLSYVAMQGIEQGYPITMIIPEDYAGFELEANGLMAEAHNPEDAKRFLDWTLSAGASESYAERKDLVTIPGAPRPPQADAANFPEDLAAVLYPMDFASSGVERDGIIAKWRETVTEH